MDVQFATTGDSPAMRDALARSNTGGGFQIAFSRTGADDWWTNPTAVGPTS